MSAAYVAKGKAKKFLQKLFDDSDKDELPDPPPRPPAKFPNAEGQSYSASDLNVPNHELVQSFNALALSNSPQYQSGPHFVGGFNPGYIPVNPPNTYTAPHRPPLPPHASSNPGPLPRPPTMPTFHDHSSHSGQQSLTMQMALRPQGPFLLSPHAPPSRPHSASVLDTSSYTTTSAVSSSGPARPTPISTNSKRPRAASAPVSPSQTTSQQCAGVTKAGKQCTRQVKSGPAFSRAYEDDENKDSSSTPIERFCFQHAKEVLGPSGYYARKDGQWINFEDWIPSYLQPDTQVSLRVEMEKSRSRSDVPGYIYTFEIRDTTQTDVVKLKVGRAVNLVKRIDQWGKQCGSKEQVLRGWYPGAVEPDESSLMKGRVKAGDKGSWCHRLERLVHLELADLALTGIYLEPSWPDTTPLKTAAYSEKKNEPCGDCGALHKEIFEFRRLKGRRKGKEWEVIVQPVIDKWGRFVDQCV